jgi:hypothetical protein
MYSRALSRMEEKEMVARDGIEPSTQGFSDPSTIEL